MNLDPKALALAQINHLVSGLSRKNSKSCLSELRVLCLQFGPEAERHLLRALIANVDVTKANNTSSSSSSTSSSSKGGSNNTNNSVSLQQEYLTQLIDSLCTRPHFTSLLVFALERPLTSQKHLLPNSSKPNYFASLARSLKLSPAKEVAFAAAATRVSQEEHSELKAQAVRHLKEKANELADKVATKAQSASTQHEAKSLLESESSPELLSLILGSLRSLDLPDVRNRLLAAVRAANPKWEQPKSLSEAVGSLNASPQQGAQAARGRKRGGSIDNQSSLSQLLLSPFGEASSLPPPESDPALTLTDTMNNTGGESGTGGGVAPVVGPAALVPEVIKDLGYQFTAKPETCRQQLVQLLAGQALHAHTVARIIGVMIRTHTGLDDSATLQNMNSTGTSLWDKEAKQEPKTWSMEVLIKVCHEIQPTLHWKEIIYELDHPGFLVKDRQALILLMKALKLGFSTQGFPGPFPVDLFYRSWKNSDSQVSLFQQILRNPDVFSFGDFSHHTVAIEVMKVQPELDREVLMWRSLELLDTLLTLADNKHPQAVMEMLSVPKSKCPDVLTLGLIQISPPLTNFRTEVLAQLIQIFLNNHPNSTVILQYAWHSTTLNLKGVIIHSMADWYTKAQSEGDTEGNRLSRILDVAQDLKALSVLLSAKAMPFVIDLAVMASRREYLNLEKWLTDQLGEHAEAFCKLLVAYLKRKFPPFSAAGSGGGLNEEHFAKANMTPDNLVSMLLCVQNFAIRFPISQELKEAIQIMLQISQPLLNRPRPPPQQQQPQQQQPGGILNRLDAPVSGAGGPPPPPGGFAPGATVRPRAMFPPTGLPPSAASDLTTQFNNLAMPSSSSSSSFNLPNVLGSLVNSSQSPGGRMFNPAPPMDGGAQQQRPATGMQSGIEQIRQGNISQMFPELPGQIPKEVEDRANSYFQRIYNVPPHPTLQISEVLDLLKKFQESTDQGERDVFNCMLKNLFEEYKYFPAYPQKELHITAQLFGGIIEQGLVTMVPLGLALRFVLDALRKPTDSNMYYFGVTALDCFKVRLKDYRQYCQHITCIEHFKDFPPHLIEWVEHGVQSQTPPGKPKGTTLPMPAQQNRDVHSDVSSVIGGGGNAPSKPGMPMNIPPPPHIGGSKAASLPPSGAAPAAASSAAPGAAASTIVRPTATTVGGRPSIANTTNIDTLLNARRKKHSAPADKVQDRIAFIFNNLSLANMTQKAEDLKSNLTDEHTGWLSHYLVVKRASIEPNFHNLYSNLIEVLRSPPLSEEVLQETYHNISILLGSDKGVSSFSDRSVLKNLGHWLGLMTLSRNKPILMLDLDLKPLIVNAYQNGQQDLLYVVPFVAKVLESAAKSRVFKPPCPWTMGIMNLLAELHQEHDLELNLKFEIEVLCKNLSVELTSLTPGTILKDCDKLNKILNFNYGMAKTPSGAPQQQQQLHVMQGSSQQQQQVSLHHPGNKSLESAFPGLAQRKLDHGATNASNAAQAAAAMGIDLGNAQMPMMPGVSAAGAFAGSANVPAALTSGNAGMAGAGMGTALAQQPQQQQHVLPPPPPQPHMDASGGTSEQQALLFQQQQAQHAAAVSAAQANNVLRPFEPKFAFADISTGNLNGIVPHLTISPDLALFKDHPDLKQLVKLAVEKAISEWMTPVIDRAIKIALTTCEQIVKKDFALDGDETRMRASACHMVRNLTAGMSMITCRDHLHLSIRNQLKSFVAALMQRGGSTAATDAQAATIDLTARTVANDNVELACAFIQKKAIEKAMPELDKKLKEEFDVRQAARKEGRPYFDPVALAYQNERMPEQIRLKVGGVTPQEALVYDDFARNIPGFKPLTSAEVADISPKGVAVAQPAAVVNDAAAAPSTPGGGPGPAIPDDCLSILAEVVSKVDPFVASCTTLPASPHMTNLHALLDGMNACRGTKETASVLALIQRVVENLLEGMTLVQNQTVEVESMAKYRDANLLALKAVADSRAYGSSWALSRITAALVEAREEIRYNLDAFDALVRNNLVNLYQYDKHLASAIAGSTEGNNAAVTFAMQICRIYLIEDRSNAQVIESDLFGTIEVLQKLTTQSPSPPEGVANLMEMIKMSSERLEQNLAMAGPTAQLHSGIQQAREYEDPPGLLEKTEFLLREWVTAYHARDAGKDSRQAFVVFVQLMNQHGILKTDDLITRFFRMSTQMCVDLCYRALGEPNNSPTLVRAKCFHTLDAYVRLITLLVKHSGESQTITKVNLLNKVLGIVAGVLLIDHDVRSTEFQQVPYHRIFIILFLELNSPDQILENINFPVLTAYCNMLHLLQPSKAPGFAYAWLEIVSHRTFLGRILAAQHGQKGWPMYAQLLVDLFKFLSPFLRNAELTKPVHRLYRGTLRVLLVLLHDFPEFLCDYHYGFCDVIPPNCIQMRNLILSAFPRNMRLPDPFTPNLKVEMLPDIGIAPRTVSNYAALIKPSFKKDLESYLKNRTPVSFLSEVREHLLVNNGEQQGNRYNIQMINALVMHVGTAAISYIRAKGQTPSMSTIAHSSHMDIFQNLAVALETEGRYLFLNCIANQLRYPNSHTHYFSSILLYLFAEANAEAIQEQITRVLLERLIVNRPHPWGLLITFIELIKNPTFAFWNHEFVTCAPEIQKLFESVARSCMVHTVPGGQQQQAVQQRMEE